LHAQPKVLLDHISLSIPPGTFVALVGSSGAGKTMLLDALSGMRPAHEGSVLYNGNDAYHHRAAFSTMLGYVPQDDLLHRNLTVERALYYTARLRLPDGGTHRQIEQRINDVLETMEITSTRKMRIRALSGGQRKRASMALELLAQPSLFFLDEPTSGLDPGLEYHIMFLLRRLADRGHTIILTTHSINNINVCDALYFLAQGGRLVYAGPPGETGLFFGKRDFAQIYNTLEPNDAHPDAPAVWEARFRSSPAYQRYIERPLQQGAMLSQQVQTRQVSTLPPPRRSHPFKQFVLLVRRYVELLYNDPVNLLILLLQAPIIAAILLALTRTNIFASHTLFDEGDAQTPLFVMVMAAIWFGTLNSAREIVKEAPIYRRERTINLGLVPYVLSKVFVLGLLCVLQSFILLYIVGLKSGYPSSGILLPPFAEMYVSLLLTSLGGLTMGLLVSSLAPNTDRAISIVPLLLIAQIIFAGNIFKLSGPAAWLSYLMLARWGMMALGSTVNLHAEATQTASGFYGHDYGHLLQAWGALGALTLVFLGLTFFFQKRKDIHR
jgi:ABC-type multidrug transport system ATPase subunit